jgi:hypothetical protein
MLDSIGSNFIDLSKSNHQNVFRQITETNCGLEYALDVCGGNFNIELLPNTTPLWKVNDPTLNLTF